MDSFSGLEGALIALSWIFVVLIPAAVFGAGIFVGWMIWG